MPTIWLNGSLGLSYNLVYWTAYAPGTHRFHWSCGCNNCMCIVTELYMWYTCVWKDLIQGHEYTVRFTPDAVLGRGKAGGVIILNRAQIYRRLHPITSDQFPPDWGCDKWTLIGSTDMLTDSAYQIWYLMPSLTNCVYRVFNAAWYILWLWVLSVSTLGTLITT